MANIIPNEGMNYVFELLVLNAKSPPSVLDVGLFTSHSPVAVPDRFAELGGVGVAEMSGNGYGRQPIQWTGWTTPGISGNGLSSVGTQVTFGPSTGSDWLQANGFFIAVPGINIAIYYANFNSLTGRVVTGSISILVTPTLKVSN